MDYRVVSCSSDLLLEGLLVKALAVPTALIGSNQTGSISNDIKYVWVDRRWKLGGVSGSSPTAAEGGGSFGPNTTSSSWWVEVWEETAAPKETEER